MSADATWQDVIEGRARWAVVHGDNAEILPQMPDRSVAHVITDPPYSPKVHNSSRRGSMRAEPGKGDAAFSRNRDLGFAALTPEDRSAMALQFGRLSRRWSLVFCDVEGVHGWREDLAASGVEPVRVGAWIKIGCTPQFTGDRPAVGFEAVVIGHPRGRKKWNGGGAHAVWSHPIVPNRGGSDERIHTTQKPLPLMLELIDLFTDVDDIVLDPFCGSGTTGEACIRLGRRFIGLEREAMYAETSRDRLTAAAEGYDSIRAMRKKAPRQVGMFGSTP